MKNIKQSIRFAQHYNQVLLSGGMKSAQKFKEDNAYLNNVSVDEIRKVHMVSENDLKVQRNTKFSSNVKISILTPLFNTPVDFLKELMDSVINQTYENWEFCLCDASDLDHAYVGEMVNSYQDPRIVYKKLESNKGISGNTNECIDISSGDYIALLDHDDILHPSALFEVVKEIEKGADFIYTDEVKFSGKVEDISNPLHFNCKAGFGIEELQSHNYICHFNVYSKALLNSLNEPYYRKDYDGSQDHDMVLRLTEKAKKISHISKVLYYWRFHDQSVSMNLDSKSYAIDAAIRAIQDQLNRKNIKGSVCSNLPYKTIYKTNLEIKEELVSVICLEKITTLENTSYKNIELLYGLESIPSAKGKYILIYNPIFKPMNENWIQELLMHAQKEDVGVVGSKLINKDLSIYYAGIVFDEKELFRIGCHNYEFEQGFEACLNHTRNTSVVEMDCMMFRKELYTPFTSDVDFCIDLMNKGYRNVWSCFSCLKATKQVEHANKSYSKYVVDDIYFNRNWKLLHLI